ncbi:MAG: T9SS type A sorting domain-containing protein [Ignavibacteriae bacterium]|nr:T9SS type A sorting domain-containing protein [Ignavibacteriota bacterium]
MLKRIIALVIILILMIIYSDVQSKEIHSSNLLDTTKPVIIHTPISATPKQFWPVSVNATVTDSSGIDSVWVRWYRNTPAIKKHFRLNNTSGNNYSAIFNSVNADVVPGDVIYYRIFAQDNSSNHNKDSTVLYNFNIINLVGCMVGLDTLSSNYPYPTYWQDGRTQMLFTASEIQQCGGLGFLTKIGFDVKSYSSQLMNGFNIRIQHTTLTSLTGWVTTGWMTIFSGTYIVPGIGYKYIDLTTPYFIYNGSSNIIIEICYDNSSYTQTSVVKASFAPGKTWGYYTDNTTGCTMTGGSAQANRPNVHLITWLDGINKNGNIIPDKYSLTQNCPNPFNPVTRIDFDIPRHGGSSTGKVFVSLKVYDVLGREVRTLVNEEKSAGSYSVDFNAAELSSGVYFYKLEADGFSDVKRMVLVK